ncbi:DUF421 domain-containing protein [Paenibacillus sp. FSL M8-0228]|jgi:uncharacterized membrane protein YcaP (DUF421 family)|uniref:DUF421 domain-containing protein n=1 Tax=Paenibacillus polymyxa TaxID=1406 RepID=A0A8I1LUN3_PAEPO|nr:MULTISPECIES: DUF421 domain-containing protein [Paenibacillus]KAF6574151.1 DUF421 domain-containing protein [Paenibacillus sp. EKM206P]KAF6588622.1 DUF421 domain-containing protein [Paenibacillus sp. EKM205P]MBM0632817.1 DUF421 domain-containing protein [Paenibacillus polymyxa]MBO3284503.1 DUF421 domain-containing protein [Paenibacillus polymyxa]MBP1308581.1 uncharacterized membrane protein YcaP (DUF421 family) [Paenibacillus sp. 1182]
MQDWAEVAIRTLMAVAILFLITKILGKRQVSQLSLFEYITGITIGNLAATIPMERESTWYLGLIALSVWVLTTLGIEYLQIKSKKIRDITDGRTTILIKDGKILEDNLRKERLTLDELMEQLRSKNVFKVSDVEFALMETSGEVNVLLTKDKQPVTLKDLNMFQLPEKEPTAVIMDGQLMEQQMAYMGITQQWLDAKLKEKSLTVKDVFFAQVDTQGELYIDPYSDNVQMSKAQDSNQAVLTLLQQCTTELQKLATNSSEQQRKQLYELCSHNLKEAIQEMQPVNSSKS